MFYTKVKLPPKPTVHAIVFCKLNKMETLKGAGEEMKAVVNSLRLGI